MPSLTASRQLAGQLTVIARRIHAEPTRHVSEAISPDCSPRDIRYEHRPAFPIDHGPTAARTLALSACEHGRPHAAVVECIRRTCLPGFAKPLRDRPNGPWQ